MAMIRCCLVLLMAVALVAFVGALTMHFLFPKMVSSKINEVSDINIMCGCGCVCVCLLGRLVTAE